MAVVLAVAAAALLALAAAVGSENPSFWLRIVYLLAAGGGFLLIVVSIVIVVRRRLEQLVGDRLVEVASPAIIRTIAPRAVLGALLPWIYGDAANHQEVLTGMLGGAGRDIAGGDTAVSRNTTAHFRIWSVDEGLVQSEGTWTHEFSGMRKSDKLVIFATHDDEIAALVAQERLFPLFELWRVLDEDALDDFGRSLRETIELGITYRDNSGAEHRVKPQFLPGTRVPLRQFDQYIRLPDEVNRQDLYIVDFDLWELADPDHVVATIESLTIKARGPASIDVGYYFWTAPHPCYVRTVTFDVTQLSLPGGRQHEFRAFGFTMRNSQAGPSRHPGNSDLIELPINSWMLPGHGVTLLWRPTG